MNRLIQHSSISGDFKSTSFKNTGCWKFCIMFQIVARRKSQRIFFSEFKVWKQNVHLQNNKSVLVFRYGSSMGIATGSSAGSWKSARYGCSTMESMAKFELLFSSRWKRNVFTHEEPLQHWDEHVNRSLKDNRGIWCLKKRRIKLFDISLV